MTALAVAAGTAAVAAGVPAAAQEGAARFAQEDVPSHEAVRSELQAMCEASRKEANIYWGQGEETRLRQELAAAPTAAEEVRRRGRLAVELLHLGRLGESLELLEQADRGARELEAQGSELDEQVELDLLVAQAIAHLQLGEDANCVERHTEASCILPIRGGAVHTAPEHVRRAGDLLLAFLDQRPQELQARWLLNLTRMLAGSYPEGVPEALRLPPGALEDEAAFPRWRDVAPALGVNVDDLAGGASMDDFDGDGLLDLVTSTWDSCKPLRAFRNDGHGGFEDVTEAWGLDVQLGAFNFNHADYDNDGDLDLLVLRGGWRGAAGRLRNSLLRNDLNASAGRFVDVTRAAGLAEPAYPTQTAAWADYDGDGDLDLYVANETRLPTVWPSAAYRDPGTYDPLQLFEDPQPLDFFAFMAPGNSFPSQLFRNNGDGTFTDVAETAGVTNSRFAKGAAWGDVDDDGDPDLFVANLGPNRLYRNDGDGTFTDVAQAAGVSEPFALDFASWFFDFDNDGDLDLFTADFTSPIPEVVAAYLGVDRGAAHPPALLRNDGGRFTHVSRPMGLGHAWLPMGANFGDLDNDGWPDIYLGTGSPDLDNLMPNVMLRNVGGTRFEDVTFAGGFGHLQKGHGIAFGDLDNDGDQDVLEQMGGLFPSDAFGNALFENPGNEASWITLRLTGTRANRFGVGARIEVRVRRGEETRSIYALAGTGGSFGSSSLEQEIGLGDAEAVESLTVRWPGSGTVQVFHDVEPNRIYRVVEGEDELHPLALPRLHLGG